MKQRQYEYGSNKLNNYVRVRLRDNEKEKLKEYAESVNMTMSELIVKLISREIKA